MLRVALSPLTAFLDRKPVDTTWMLAFLFVVSGLTNLLMIGLVWAFVSRRLRILNVHFWMSVGASIINSHWYVLPSGFELQAGYFLWWLESFLLLAGGIHTVLRVEGR